MTHFVMDAPDLDDGTPEPADAGDRFVTDEDLAAHSAATLLITASTPHEAEAVARRVHQAGGRRGGPFVIVQSATLPADPRALDHRFAALLAAARGGTLLLSAVDEMPSTVQIGLLTLLDRTQHPRRSLDVRFVAATTTRLHDRVTSGSFSESLFYRLNSIHLVATAHSGS